jgi:hypothetical protein
MRASLGQRRSACRPERADGRPGRGAGRCRRPGCTASSRRHPACAGRTRGARPIGLLTLPTGFPAHTTTEPEEEGYHDVQARPSSSSYADRTSQRTAGMPALLFAPGSTAVHRGCACGVVGTPRAVADRTRPRVDPAVPRRRPAAHPLRGRCSAASNSSTARTRSSWVGTTSRIDPATSDATTARAAFPDALQRRSNSARLRAPREGFVHLLEPPAAARWLRSAEWLPQGPREVRRSPRIDAIARRWRPASRRAID